MAVEVQVITRDLLRAGMSDAGGWNRSQLAILGVSWPPVAGWQSEILGKRIATEHARNFVALRGNAGRVRPRRSATPSPSPQEAA